MEEGISLRVRWNGELGGPLLIIARGAIYLLHGGYAYQYAHARCINTYVGGYAWLCRIGALVQVELFFVIYIYMYIYVSPGLYFLGTFVFGMCCLGPRLF